MNDEQERIRELMDACRPGHDDLASPEFQLLAERIKSDESLKARFQRSQQLDAAITTAFQDVDIPPGLADRLLDVVSVRREDESCEADGSPTETVRRRRRWLAAAGILGTAATILVVIFNFTGPEPLSATAFAGQALKWTEPAGVAEGSWGYLNSNSRVLVDSPPGLPAAVKLEFPRRWRAVSQSKAVCYELQAFDKGTPAYLIVLPEQPNAGFAASPVLTLSTAGRCVAVWASKGHLYALVIDGNKRRYRSLVRSSPTA